MPPEISIIIPSYNQPPQFVTACFESICAQQGAEYEIIFVDGGSGPETLAARSRTAPAAPISFPSGTRARPTPLIKACASRAAISSHG